VHPLCSSEGRSVRSISWGDLRLRAPGRRLPCRRRWRAHKLWQPRRAARNSTMRPRQARAGPTTRRMSFRPETTRLYRATTAAAFSRSTAPLPTAPTRARPPWAVRPVPNAAVTWTHARGMCLRAAHRARPVKCARAPAATLRCKAASPGPARASAAISASTRAASRSTAAAVLGGRTASPTSASLLARSLTKQGAPTAARRSPASCPRKRIFVEPCTTVAATRCSVRVLRVIRAWAACARRPLRSAMRAEPQNAAPYKTRAGAATSTAAVAPARASA